MYVKGVFYVVLYFKGWSWAHLVHFIVRPFLSLIV